MTAENTKIKKRVLNYLESSYGMTKYDIQKYIRQTGSITIDVIKRLIRWNYFKNEDAVDLWTHDDGENNVLIAMDMFDLELWLTENYGIDIDMLNDIEDEISYFTTIGVRLK